MAKNFTDVCKSIGISPSITRKMIYEFIEGSKTHPTADDIYRSLIDTLPTLSKTTVYNVVNLFLENDFQSARCGLKASSNQYKQQRKKI